MSIEVSIAEARDQLSTWVRSAEHGSAVVLTRRGKPVAAIVSADEFRRLERLRAAGPMAGLAGLAGGWECSDELIDAVESLERTSARPDLDLG